MRREKHSRVPKEFGDSHLSIFNSVKKKPSPRPARRVRRESETREPSPRLRGRTSRWCERVFQEAPLLRLVDGVGRAQ